MVPNVNIMPHVVFEWSERNALWKYSEYPAGHDLNGPPPKVMTLDEDAVKRFFGLTPSYAFECRMVRVQLHDIKGIGEINLFLFFLFEKGRLATARAGMTTGLEDACKINRFTLDWDFERNCHPDDI